MANKCNQCFTMSDGTIKLCYDCLEKRLEELESLLDEIEAVSCGEKQIESDGVYNDSDGLLWIYKRIQALKEGSK